MLPSIHQLVIIICTVISLSPKGPCIHSLSLIEYIYWEMVLKYLGKLSEWKWVFQSCLLLFVIPWAIARQTPLHGILQARILEWVAIPFSRHLPDSGIKPRSPALQADSLPSEPPGKPLSSFYSLLKHVSLHTGQCWWELQSGSPDLLGTPPPKKPSEKPQSSLPAAPQPTKWATPHLHPSGPPRTLPSSNHFLLTVWT